MPKHRTVVSATVQLTLYTNEPLDQASIASAVQAHLARNGAAWQAGNPHPTAEVVSHVQEHRIVEPRVDVGRFCRFCGVKDPTTFEGACTRCGEPGK